MNIVNKTHLSDFISNIWCSVDFTSCGFQLRDIFGLFVLFTWRRQTTIGKQEENASKKLF